MKKIFPSKIGLFKSYIVVAIIILVVLYLAFSSRLAWTYSSEDDVSGYIIQDVAIIIVAVVLDVVLWFVLVAKNYYEVINDGIVHHQIGRETTYNYDNVLYINEDYTVKHKTLLFYNKEGKELFLVLDKNFELFDLFRENCEKLISKDEFRIRFPRVKL